MTAQTYTAIDAVESWSLTLTSPEHADGMLDVLLLAARAEAGVIDRALTLPADADRTVLSGLNRAVTTMIADAGEWNSQASVDPVAGATVLADLAAALADDLHQVARKSASAMSAISAASRLKDVASMLRAA